MKTGYTGRLFTRNHGSTLVEFALVLPLLALILFGICQYGFLFAAYITVRNASAVGARQAIIGTNNATAVAKAALGPMLDPSKAPQPVLTITNVSGPAYSMTVSYPVPLIIPWVVPPFPNVNKTRTLTATTIMR